MRKLFAMAVVLCALAGCGSTAPKLSPEEAQARRIASLNLYEDNRVAFSVRDGDGSVTYVWSKNPQEVIALEVDAELFNAKDLLEMTSQGAYTNQRDVRIKFANGKSRDVRFEKVRWIKCDTTKKCSQHASVDLYPNGERVGPGFDELLGSAFMKVHAASLNSDFGHVRNARTIDYRAGGERRAAPVPSSPIQDPARAPGLPYAASQGKILVLTDAQRAELQAAVAAMTARFDKARAEFLELQSKALNDKDAAERARVFYGDRPPTRN